MFNILALSQRVTDHHPNFLSKGETMEQCPICNEPFEAEEETETELCNICAHIRFYNDDIREIRYRKDVQIRIAELKAVFKDDYNEILHNDMVEQMIRAEIATKHYEWLIANNLEAPQTSELLKSERAQWNKLAEKLHMTIKSMRGDTKNINHDFSPDFKEYWKQVLGEDYDSEEEEAKPIEE
jgi:hypothetical protein